MDFIANIGNNIGGYRYEFVFCTTLPLCHCYQMIAYYQTIDGVPRELEIVQTFTPEVYHTNVLDSIKKAKSHIFHSKTNAAPAVLQKTVMAEVLNALGFFAETWGKLLGTSIKVIIELSTLSNITL